MLRRLAAMVLLALSAAAPSSAFVGQVVKRGDLDGDSERETVRALPFGPPGDFRRTQVRVTDSCPAAVDTRIAPVHDNLETLRLIPADRRRGSEVFLIMRDGARDALGEARLVAWRPRHGQPCREPKPLFVYDTDHHTRTPSGGNGNIAFFTASIRDITKRFRGPEIAIDERFTRPADPPSFGTLKKVTYWRYSPKSDRYTRYRTILRHLSVPAA